MTYEASIRRLEEIVTALSTGAKPISESLALFREGVRLLKAADEALSDAETEAATLLGEPEG